MKLTRLEGAALIITALTLCAMLLCFFGGRSSAGVTVDASASDPEAEPSRSLLLDLNEATADELMLLPGIGEVKAQAIVDYRAQNGPFTSVEELTNVKGIGEGILAQIRDYVTVNEGGTEDG